MFVSARVTAHICWGGVGGTLLACDDISEGHDSGQRLHQFYIDCGKLGGEGGIGCEKGCHGRVIMHHGSVIILLEYHGCFFVITMCSQYLGPTGRAVVNLGLPGLTNLVVDKVA